jgi:hypothetical protein
MGHGERPNVLNEVKQPTKEVSKSLEAEKRKRHLRHKKAHNEEE